MTTPSNVVPIAAREAHAQTFYTEANLAQVLVNERFVPLGVRWANGLGWLSWTSTHWAPVTEAYVVETARQWALSHANRAVTMMKQGLDDKISADGWIHVARTASRLKAIVGLTRGIAEVLTTAEQLDAHPDLLNTPNGVVDLTTGELRPHDMELLLTRCTAVGYTPGAQHLDWAAALQALPEDVRGYAQVRYGQGATGHMTPDDTLVVQQGAGENGKSTVMNAIATALGDYYTHVSDRVLLANPGDHPTEFMDLRGARLALIEETPESRRLSVARLKKIVGTPRITARRIRQDDVTFDATHTLFVSTNYAPSVDETDHGTWRRLMLLRYPYRFRKPHEPLELPDDRRGDPGLRDRTSTDPAVLAAALAWLVDGAAVWYQLGRVMPRPPARIVEDTQGWRESTDLVLSYVNERLELDPASKVMSSELFEDYNDWLTAHGQARVSEKTFVSRFASHDSVSGKVERRKVRTTSGELSRRDAYGFPRKTAPISCWGWVGIRFHNPAQSPIKPAETTGSPVTPLSNWGPR